MRYWLMKSEPDVFSIDDLAARAHQTEHWDGVRNYQARNYMREMQVGDQVFFYHSNTQPPGIVGIAEVVRAAYPDFTSWDPRCDYYDPKSTPEAPRWSMVDVRFVRKLRRPLSLDELRAKAELADMALVQRGSRLSVLPLTDEQWATILKME